MARIAAPFLTIRDVAAQVNTIVWRERGTVMKFVTVLLCLLLGTAAMAQDGPPFSKARIVGNTIYLAGELGINPDTGKLAAGGIGPETRQTLTNIRATLQANGSDMDKVVKCLVMLADIDEWGAMNEVYRTFFSQPYPARSAFGASGLAIGARVEIECIATVN